jgi:hypothetical protein
MPPLSCRSVSPKLAAMARIEELAARIEEAQELRRRGFGQIQLKLMYPSFTALPVS